MFKRFTALALIVVFALSVAACKRSDTPASDASTSVDPTGTSSSGEAIIEEGEVIVQPEVPPQPVLTEKDNKLVPEGAEVLSIVEGSMSLSSNADLATLKEFYLNVAKDLGVTGKEVDIKSDTPGVETWSYEGTYSDGKPFSVSIITASGQAGIVVLY